MPDRLLAQPSARILAYLKWGAILYLVIYRVGKLDNTIYERHAWRQADTVMMVEGFFRHGIDLLRPEVGWLGRHYVRPFEFPAPQALIAWLYSFTGPEIWMSKAVFLAAYLVGCLYLFLLVRRYGNQSWAEWSLFCYLVFPLTIYYSVGMQIDYLTVSACLALLFHALRYLDERRWPDLASYGLAFMLAGLEKPPYLFVVGFLVMAQALRVKNRAAIPALAIVTLPGLIATVAWIRHSDVLNAQAPLLSFLPGFSPIPNLTPIYFGTLAQRSDIGSYYMLFGRSLESFGVVACIAFVGGWVAVLQDKRMSVRMWQWTLIGALVMVFTFINLNLFHNYYQSPIAIPIAVFAGLGLANLSDRLPVLAGFALLLALANSLFTANTELFRRQPCLMETGALLSANTRPEEMLLFVQNDLRSNSPVWPGVSRRFGFCIDARKLTPATLDSVQLHQVHKLVLIPPCDSLSAPIRQKLRLTKSLSGENGCYAELYDILP